MHSLDLSIVCSPQMSGEVHSVHSPGLQQGSLMTVSVCRVSVPQEEQGVPSVSSQPLFLSFWTVPQLPCSIQSDQCPYTQANVVVVVVVVVVVSHPAVVVVDVVSSQPVVVVVVSPQPPSSAE